MKRHVRQKRPQRIQQWLKEAPVPSNPGNETSVGIAIISSADHRSATSMISSWIGRAAILAAMLLTGCGSLGVLLGTRTRLDKLPVTAVSAQLSPQPYLTPGKSGRLILVASGSDGRKWTTVGAGRGNVLFDSYTLESTVVKTNSSGAVSLPADPRLSSGKQAHVHITVVGHPDVQTDLDVPVKYNAAFTAHFPGASGNDGMSGLDGLAGLDGTMGSLDPANPQPGGNGSNGADGGPGSDGTDGWPGESVHLWVTLQPGSTPLIQARAIGSRNDEQFFLVDPNGGSLSIDAYGGDGGRGGRGGRGGAGGSGGVGSPNGMSGNAGRDGSDGHDGSPGAPGKIIVTIDPAADIYRDRLHLSTQRGRGADPGVVFHTEPVPPLW